MGEVLEDEEGGVDMVVERQSPDQLEARIVVNYRCLQRNIRCTHFGVRER